MVDDYNYTFFFIETIVTHYHSYILQAFIFTYLFIHICFWTMLSIFRHTSLLKITHIFSQKTITIVVQDSIINNMKIKKK